ncbi:phage tail protein [Clostridium sp. CX1]|uniref:phage tail protein n=1 Tax=Clostridium sp. CX1 TaxID=2978346 RepID=UPI0021C10656|nr:phage tail protein [Clostridium sp. CX1]MCT8975488.1 phage tail protein [Clostridium sp. CX1]
MAKIGSFGEIVFEVSEKITQTFSNLKRSGSVRWAEHEVNQKKPISEFIGAELEEISFDILLKAELGVNPSKQLEKLREIRDTGKVDYFIIGGKPVSQNYWYIQQMSEAYNVIDSNGNILSAEVNVTLKEYRL